MSMLKMVPKWVTKASPLGLILAGTAIAAATPAGKTFLRRTAVTVTRGILTIAGSGANLAADLKAGLNNLVEEAKAQKAAEKTVDTPNLDVKEH